MKVDRQKEVLRRGRRVQVYLTGREYKRLFHQFERSGQSSLSAYLRRRLTGSKSAFEPTTDFISAISRIGFEMNRVGNNLNQLARYVHAGQKAGVFNPRMIEQYNALQSEYIRLKEELSRQLTTLLSRR